MLHCSQHPEAAATTACTRCNRPMCDGCTDLLEGRPYCVSCVDELRHELDQRDRMDADEHAEATDAPEGTHSAAPIAPETPVAWGRAALFGIVAGLVGAGIWYGTVVISDHKLGLVAIGVGWMVGAACAHGAADRRSTGLGALSLAIAVAAMFAGEYLIINHYFLKAFAEHNPGAEARAFTPLGLFLYVYAKSVGPPDVVFYAIGAYEAYKIPAALRTR